MKSSINAGDRVRVIKEFAWVNQEFRAGDILYYVQDHDDPMLGICRNEKSERIVAYIKGLDTEIEHDKSPNDWEADLELI